MAFPHFADVDVDAWPDAAADVAGAGVRQAAPRQRWPSSGSGRSSSSSASGGDRGSSHGSSSNEPVRVHYRGPIKNL